MKIYNSATILAIQILKKFKFYLHLNPCLFLFKAI